MAMGWPLRVMAAVGLFAFGGAALAQSLPLTPSLSQQLQASDFAGGAGNCVLVSNVWNPKTVPPGFAQSVDLKRRGDAMLPGWTWNTPGNRAEVLSMPEIVCGDKPWDTPKSLRSEFPFRAGEKAPVIDFDIDLKAEGTFNMAFSLWAVSKQPAVRENIALEIMVWNVAHGQQPSGEKIGAVNAAGTVFDLYLKKDQGMVTGPDPFTWPLVQFVARDPLTKGTLDLRPFLDDLIARGLLQRGAWLTSVELGNEVTDGRGEVRLKTLAVDLR